MSKITKECTYCGKIVPRRSYKFCSRKCYNKYRHIQMIHRTRNKAKIKKEPTYELHYGEDEFYLKLFEAIKHTVEKSVDKYYYLKRGICESEDIIQMVFLKCFKPRKSDGASLYKRYLDQPLKNWHLSIGPLAVYRMLKDLYKNSYIDLITDKTLVYLPGEEIAQFGYLPNNNYIGEFLDLYGDITLCKSKPIKLKIVLQDLINGYKITETCIKHHIKPNDLRAKLEELNFRYYL